MSRWATRAGIPAISTFSIAASDPATGEVAVAVQSKFLAVGAAVPWVTADAGAVATQSWSNSSFGPRGLHLLRDGVHPEEVLRQMLAEDPDRDYRQVGIVDLQGRSATFTGNACFPWAGGIAKHGFACQGNILAGEAVVQDMADTFERASSLRLAERLVAALAAGQQAGGDRRGMQSAALYVARAGGGYGGFNDRYIDLRVDDHPTPIQELSRLLDLHRLYFERSAPDDLVVLTDDLATEVSHLLHQLGYAPGAGASYDDTLRNALRDYCMTENFEEKWTEEAVIDRRILEYMRRAGS